MKRPWKSPIDQSPVDPNRTGWLVPQERRGPREFSEAYDSAEAQKSQDLLQGTD